ncbi:MAG: 16S rRNA (adenine(1518)-N(6)/adenine(1519)-N(6))-dimethyltransferase RsmA [Bacteroidales bacterium]|jgi:16S rRNA (adenine1518-N6/adenine1519-N6)-dimethyltransferase|nr:16S rRNA (adenine(1518)-N(6)/adenine(1519)-N(6))-dimethyltransferase RsmA [Bacteroidales bacterium]MCI1784816.1 16S rRNA (adenine(1518)-N(6)/adenine(1519)-N(6))-dimethyltransferase RsmA [Bacteroidales bacterium]
MKVRAKKALGQHFLNDLATAKKITESLSVNEEGGKTDRGQQACPADVLEIGPGTGVLTDFLLKRSDVSLKAVEIDNESVNYLLDRFPELEGKLIEGDFLKLKPEDYFPGDFRIIGNFPYNISSQIFFRILEYKDNIPEIVCMIQKEVAQRIAEKPGTKVYGILSVFLQTWYDIEYLMTVGPEAFTPPPKVRSAVIRLKRNSRTSIECDEKLFKTVVKTAFNQRRKTMRNSLRGMIENTGKPELISDPIFDLRPERLGPDEFISLTKRFE